MGGGCSKGNSCDNQIYKTERSYNYKADLPPSYFLSHSFFFPAQQLWKQMSFLELCCILFHKKLQSISNVLQYKIMKYIPINLYIILVLSNLHYWFITIHKTNYENSDWSRAYSHYTIACEVEITQRLPNVYIFRYITPC